MGNELYSYFQTLGAMSAGYDPEHENRAVTVRIPPHLLCELDALAAASGIGTRQNLMLRLIKSGLKEATDGFLNACDPSAEEAYQHALERNLQQHGLDWDQYRTCKDVDEAFEDQQEMPL